MAYPPISALHAVRRPKSAFLKKGAPVAVNVMLPADLADFVASRTVKENKSIAYIVRRALMFERDRVNALHPDADAELLDYQMV